MGLIVITEMIRSGFQRYARVLLLFYALALPVLSASAGDTLKWNKERVSADIKSEKLGVLLKQISSATGWKVYVEPGTSREISAKFQDLPPGQALRIMLGELNFALVPGTNGPSKLFVYRTGMSSATQLVHSNGKAIPNELIVRLKPGANIDDLARRLGGKVLARIGNLNAYRLQFENESATANARQRLAADSEIAGIENNYEIDRADPIREALGADVSPLSLQLKPPSDNGRIVVGLIDTAVQPLGGDLDKFLMKQIHVAGPADLDPSEPAHGTSMAETLLRSLQFMTKGSTSVQILPVDVYGSNPSSSTFDVANGIIQAVNGGAKVINLSLGSDADSPILRDVIQAVAAKNIPIFAAAGNEPTTTPFYPAAYPEVMAVTAVDHGQIASYANRGPFILFGAPGTSLVYYNDQPWYVTGTSTASAFTAGIAAGYLDTKGATAGSLIEFLSKNLALRPGSGH
jgi:hypothetical protein